MQERNTYSSICYTQELMNKGKRTQDFKKKTIARSRNLQKSSIVWTEMSGGHHAVDKVAHGAACSVPRRRIAWLEDHITMTSLCFLPQRGRTHYVPLPPELQKGIGEEDGPVTAAGQQWGGG